MRPAAVLIAIVFGSAAAISFGLMATSVVFLFLRGDHPRLEREIYPLLASCAWFVALAGVSGAALYSTLKGLRWKRYAQIATALTLTAVTIVFLPR